MPAEYAPSRSGRSGRPGRTDLAASIAAVLVVLFLAPALRAAQPEPLHARRGMVVSASALASAAGVEILEAGGNATDAAVATSLALSVAEPFASGIGGGGFALVFDEGHGDVRALDFREKAPARATRDMFLKDGKADPALSQTGALSVAVPGQIRGLVELHRAHGRLPWARLVQPSLSLAQKGFPVTPRLRDAIERTRGRFDPAARAIFMPGGDLPKVGQLLVQKDLAATLETIMAQGADGFHDGPVAERIAAAVQKAGGVLTVEDLRDYRAVWRTPTRGAYRGATIWSMPPPSSGGVHLVQMLNILERFPLPKSGYGAATTLHPMIEAMKFAYADRSRFLGDPDHVEVPSARLTSLEYAAELTKRIRPDKAIPASEVEGVSPAGTGSVHTSHFSIVDADGNAVSSTQTINLTFGSGMVATGTGVVLNDEMDDFAAAPGVPNAFGLIGSDANAVAPNKRPLSSMTPAIVMVDGKVRLVVGSPGGSRIITAVLQVVLNVLDHGMDIAQAVGAPRIHHQWSPAEVRVEPYGVSPDTQALLRAMGHPIVVGPLGTNVQAILKDPKTGALTGASDPRGEGAPAGY